MQFPDVLSATQDTKLAHRRQERLVPVPVPALGLAEHDHRVGLRIVQERAGPPGEVVDSV
jgi:hypothetical protein